MLEGAAAEALAEPVVVVLVAHGLVDDVFREDGGVAEPSLAVRAGRVGPRNAFAGSCVLVSSPRHALALSGVPERIPVPAALEEGHVFVRVEVWALVVVFFGCGGD